jgi:hypothetical protein
MGRQRLDPTSAAEWLTISKDLLLDLLTEITRAREESAKKQRARKGTASVVRKAVAPRRVRRGKRTRT